jgi:putative AbiEi antitoxin of type IV toxin-antitoxin system
VRATRADQVASIGRVNGRVLHFQAQGLEMQDSSWASEEGCGMDGKGGTDSGKGVDRALAGLAVRQHGLVTRRQLLELGIGAGLIEARLARGQLHRVRRGVYSVGHRLLTRQGHWMATVLACGPEAVLSHRSAGQLWGILPAASHVPEISRPTDARIGGWVVTHRAALPRDEVGVEARIPVTSPFRTVLDLAGVLSRRSLERVLHEVEVKGVRDRFSLPFLLDRHPRKRGVAILRELLGTKEPGGTTRNDLEEGFVALLDRYGLPRPRLNGTLALRGRFFEPDCIWDEQRLLVELDGRAAHGTERAFERDRERDRILLAEGWRSTRVTWRQLRDEPAAIAADLRAQLAIAGGSPA